MLLTLPSPAISVEMVPDPIDQSSSSARKYIFLDSFLSRAAKLGQPWRGILAGIPTTHDIPLQTIVTSPTIDMITRACGKVDEHAELYL
jgi:hypothetical protein